MLGGLVSGLAVWSGGSALWAIGSCSSDLVSARKLGVRFVSLELVFSHPKVTSRSVRARQHPLTQTVQVKIFTRGMKYPEALVAKLLRLPTLKGL